MPRALPILLLILGVAAPGCAPAAAPAAAKPPALAAPPPPPEVSFPSTPAGDAAAAWLRAANDGSREETLAFYRARYAPALLAGGDDVRRRDFVHELRVLEGRRHVRAIESATPTKIVAILESERTETWSRNTIEVDPNPPHLIVASGGDVIEPPGEVPPKDDHEAEATLDAYVTRMCDRGAFSGAVAVARQGTVIYGRACGLASRAFQVPNKLDTKFNLGSMNKMFTALSIAQLVDAGKLRYEDTLAKAWPEYPNRAVAEKITIDQLLTHTSGLGDYFTEEYERTAKDRLRAIKDYLPLFAGKPLEFEPGKQFRYSNAGFMVLGGVVQRVSGEDYFDYVRAHVYAPAGMKSSDAFEMDHDTPNLAIGYTWDRSGPSEPIALDKVRNNLYLHVVKGGPAGGGFSTVGDLIAFGDALVRGKLVSPAQVAILTRPHSAGFGGGGPGGGYGYGFDIDTINGQRVIGHGGGFDGINARLAVFPETGLSVAAMANLDPPAADRVAGRAGRLFAHAPPPR
jgi:CubicO group peptidase (beta-lactamase class C family)